MKPDRILQLLSATARGVGGDYGVVVAQLFDAVGELVATRGVEDAVAQIRELLENPPRKADLTRMEEALRRREASEPDRGFAGTRRKKKRSARSEEFGEE